MAKAKKKQEVYVIIDGSYDNMYPTVFKSEKKAMAWFTDMVKDGMPKDVTPEKAGEILDKALSLMFYEYPTPGDGQIILFYSAVKA